MKLSKLIFSFFFFFCLSTSSFAADSLAAAFKEGKVSGALQAYYFNKDNGTTDAGIFSTGLDLSYETASLNGFAFKATFQSSASPFADDEGKAMYNGSMYGSGAQLSEVYLSYTAGKTTALVGRMYLDTPLVASSGSRLNKEAFEGAAIINTDLANTTLIAGYVQKFQSRTDGSGGFGKFRRVGATNVGMVPFEDGAYTLAAINKSIAGLTLTGAYADVIDIAQVAYVEAAYEGKGASFTYGVAGQYYYSEVDGTDDTNLFGVKVNIGVGDFSFVAAYSKADDSFDVVSGLGNGADLAYTMSPLNSYSYAADTEAYKIGAAYAVTKSANVGISYTVNEVGALEYAYSAIEADYACEGPLKGLSVSAVYEDQSKDADGNELWLKANYKF